MKKPSLDGRLNKIRSWNGKNIETGATGARLKDRGEILICNTFGSLKLPKNFCGQGRYTHTQA